MKMIARISLACLVAGFALLSGCSKRDPETAAEKAQTPPAPPAAEEPAEIRVLWVGDGLGKSLLNVLRDMSRNRSQRGIVTTDPTSNALIRFELLMSECRRDPLAVAQLPAINKGQYDAVIIALPLRCVPKAQDFPAMAGIASHLCDLAKEAGATPIILEGDYLEAPQEQQQAFARFCREIAAANGARFAPAGAAWARVAKERGPKYLMSDTAQIESYGTYLTTAAVFAALYDQDPTDNKATTVFVERMTMDGSFQQISRVYRLSEEGARYLQQNAWAAYLESKKEIAAILASDPAKWAATTKAIRDETARCRDQAAQAATQQEQERRQSILDASQNARPLPQLTKTPAIDGKLDEWQDIPAMPSLAPAKGKSSVRMAWDQSGLWGAVQAEDNTFKIYENYPWAGDSFEVWVESDLKRAPNLHINAIQFFFTPIAKKTAQSIHARRIDNGYTVPGSQYATGVTKTGYAIEFFIPAQEFQSSGFHLGRTFGFGWAINNDGQSVLQGEIDKNADPFVFRKPIRWGSFALAPAPAPQPPAAKPSAAAAPEKKSVPAKPAKKDKAVKRQP